MKKHQNDSIYNETLSFNLSKFGKKFTKPINFQIWWILEIKYTQNPPTTYEFFFPYNHFMEITQDFGTSYLKNILALKVKKIKGRKHSHLFIILFNDLKLSLSCKVCLPT
jgi:hypothetical protein